MSATTSSESALSAAWSDLRRRGRTALIPYLTARYFGLKAFGRIYGSIFVLFYTGVALGPLAMGWVYDTYGAYTIGLLFEIPILAFGVLLVVLLGRPPQFK